MRARVCMPTCRAKQRCLRGRRLLEGGQPQPLPPGMRCQRRASGRAPAPRPGCRATAPAWGPRPWGCARCDRGADGRRGRRGGVSQATGSDESRHPPRTGVSAWQAPPWPHTLLIRSAARPRGRAVAPLQAGGRVEEGVACPSPVGGQPRDWTPAPPVPAAGPHQACSSTTAPGSAERRSASMPWKRGRKLRAR